MVEYSFPGYGRHMAFGKRHEESKPLNQYKSLSVRDQAMVKALSEWLTVDELAARRRALVRDYDREMYGARPDPDRVSAIQAEADAIEQVQRGRRAN